MYDEGHGAGDRLAAAMGVDASQISRWRNGTHAPQAAARIRLMERYGIPLTAWDEAIPADTDVA